MLLAVCGGLAALVAGTCRLRADSATHGWWLLAVVMGVFSLEWMTGLARLLFDIAAMPRAGTGLVVAAGVVAAMSAIADGGRGSRPSRAVGGWTAVLCLVLVSRTLVGSGAAALPAALKRVLEWIAVLSLAVACARLLALNGPRFAVRVNDDGGGPVRLRHGHAGIDVRVCPSAVRRRTTAAIVLLSIASIASAGFAHALGTTAEPWYRFLFVDFEGNLPTWFSAVLLLAAGVAAAVVAMAERARGHESWWNWALMAGGFVALSADEAASLHELLVAPLRALVGGTPWLRYPLVIPGTAVAGVVVVVFGRFVKALPAETRRAIVGGGAVFLFGALVLETVGGWFDPVLYGANLPYVLLAGAEEACEMTGVTIVLIGLLRYLEHHIGVVDVCVVDDRSVR